MVVFSGLFWGIFGGFDPGYGVQAVNPYMAFESLADIPESVARIESMVNFLFKCSCSEKYDDS